MRKKILLYLSVIALMAIIVIKFNFSTQPAPSQIQYPNDWFYYQRAFPYKEINYTAYKKALLQAQAMKSQTNKRAEAWTFAGPTNIGGRITDVEMSPTNFDTIYAGAASGGVFLSTDGGTSWAAIFDNALSLSIGDIAIDPGNPKTIYVGTGESNAGGGSTSYSGMGVYKSTDAGQSWTHLGLEETRYTGRMLVDPSNSQRVYLAAMGKLYGKNEQRGLYRSDDGGLTWQKKLYLSDSTGCIDLVVDPNSSNIVYAAMWERIRYPSHRQYGGITCGIYKSTDYGETWTEMTNGVPNNSPSVGRIGLAISQSDPNILYAIYADNVGYFAGVFKTTNSGSSWTRTNDSALSGLYSSYGWWFGNIRVNPANPDIVYAMGLYIYRSTNGGNGWQYSSAGIHVDQHGMYIHPQNTNYLVVGNDGGVYVSNDGGSGYSKSPNLPVTQFYTCEVDESQPLRLYGGTQDNGTNRTMTGNVDDWEDIYGGDGFYCLVDLNDNNYVYAESQYGNLGRSTDGGYSFSSATNGIDSGDRNNWSSPLAMDPSNPHILYFGTQRVYKSTNRAESWTAISDDLSNGSVSGSSSYGTVTTIAVAPSDGNVIYAGTDDGNVWVTPDGGADWDYISSDLPVRFITRVAVDPADAQIAYVTISGYTYDEYLPHIFRTTDAGQNWQDISGNLPEAPLNDVIVDPVNNSTLYVASDVGVYVTYDLGLNWEVLGGGFPNVQVSDLRLHQPTRTLLASTFGRSMYKIDLQKVSAIEKIVGNHMPVESALLQNYPNPFNPLTVISWQLPMSGDVEIVVYNLLGQKVFTLISQKQEAGKHSVTWNASAFPSGVYLCVLRTGSGAVKTRKIVLLR